jgi:hypothetical protein
MALSRRSFIRGAGALAAVVGPFSLAGRQGHAATASTPALEFLTPSEYTYINNMAKVVVPDAPVLDGSVDVAMNLDRFFAKENTSPDFLIMMRYLRLIRLADPVLPLLNRLVPATGEDIESFKKTICFLGYYSDANGEADMPPEQRVVWPRLGYGGPKPDDWWPPDSEVMLDPSLLTDRIKEEGA